MPAATWVMIQIQPMLRLNYVGWTAKMQCKCGIQIQPMLRLNVRPMPVYSVPGLIFKYNQC